MASFAPGDIVPSFRSDLKLTDVGHATGDNVISATDPQSGKEITLRGFELSLARMLNGSRTAAEIVQQASSIGLPITLETLSRFVAHLRALGLIIDHPATGRGPKTTWPPREQWPEAQRSQFQVALREARTNLLQDAKGHLDQLRQDAFAAPEVDELHAWVENSLKESGDSESRPSFGAIFSSIEQSWFEQGDLESQASERPSRAPAADDVVPAEPERAPSSRRLWLAMGGLFVVTAIVMVAVIPWPTHVPGTFALEPVATVQLAVVTGGVVGRVDAHEGQWVVPGDMLFDYDTETPKKKLAEIEARQAAIQQQIDQLAQAVAVPQQQLDAAHAELDAAQAEHDVAQAANRRHDTARAQKRVEAAQTKITAAEAALTKAKADAEAAAGVTHDALTAQLAAAATEHDAQKALAELPPQQVSATGVVTGLGLKAGQVVQPGSALCQIADTRQLAVAIHADDPTVLHAPQSVFATIDGERVDIQIDKVEHGEGHGQLDNPGRKFQPGTQGDASIVVERKTLLARWF